MVTLQKEEKVRYYNIINLSKNDQVTFCIECIIHILYVSECWKRVYLSLAKKGTSHFENEYFFVAMCLNGLPSLAHITWTITMQHSQLLSVCTRDP